jgi:putative transcriptional regulator
MKMTMDEIKVWRISMKMTQEDFAHFLGVTFTTVNSWENHHRRPSKMAMSLLTQKKKEYDERY